MTKFQRPEKPPRTMLQQDRPVIDGAEDVADRREFAGGLRVTLLSDQEPLDLVFLACADEIGLHDPRLVSADRAGAVSANTPSPFGPARDMFRLHRDRLEQALGPSAA